MDGISVIVCKNNEFILEQKSGPKYKYEILSTLAIFAFVPT